MEIFLLDFTGASFLAPVIATAIVLAALVLLAVKSPGVAVIASPVCLMVALCVPETVFEFGGCDADASLAVLKILSPLLFFVPLLTVLVVGPREGEDHWPQRAVKWLFALLGAAVAGTVLLFLLGLLGMLSMGFLVLLAAVVVRYLWVRAHVITTYVVSTIGSVMRQNLPLADALLTEADGRADKRGRVLTDIGEYLLEGYPLSDAVQAGFRGCPGHVLAMIVAGERAGQVPSALAAIEADLAKRGSEIAKYRPVHPLYPLVLLFFMVPIVGVLGIFVIPKFKDIFDGMAIELPRSTVLLFEGMRIVGPLLGLLMGMMLVAVPLFVYTRFRPRRAGDPHLLSRVGDWVKWRLPVLHWFEKGFSMLQAVECLRLSLVGGATVDAAIANTLDLDVNESYRARLRDWFDQVMRGRDVADAARASGVGAALARAFDTKLGGDDAPRILEDLEGYCRANYTYARNVARNILWPVTMILYGVLIGFITYSLFAPLARMIDYMNATVMP